MDELLLMTCYSPDDLVDKINCGDMLEKGRLNFIAGVSLLC